MKVAYFHRIEDRFTGEFAEYPIDMISAEQFMAMMSNLHSPDALVYKGVVAHDLEEEWSE